jgi:hypothetical protein
MTTGVGRFGPSGKAVGDVRQDNEAATHVGADR